MPYLSVAPFLLGPHSLQWHEPAALGFSGTVWRTLASFPVWGVSRLGPYAHTCVFAHRRASVFAGRPVFSSSRVEFTFYETPKPLFPSQSQSHTGGVGGSHRPPALRAVLTVHRGSPHSAPTVRVPAAPGRPPALQGPLGTPCDGERAARPAATPGGPALPTRPRDPAQTRPHPDADSGARSTSRPLKSPPRPARPGRRRPWAGGRRGSARGGPPRTRAAPWAGSPARPPPPASRLRAPAAGRARGRRGGLRSGTRRTPASGFSSLFPLPPARRRLCDCASAGASRVAAPMTEGLFAAETGAGGRHPAAVRVSGAASGSDRVPGPFPAAGGSARGAPRSCDDARHERDLPGGPARRAGRRPDPERQRGVGRGGAAGRRTQGVWLLWGDPPRAPGSS